MTNTRLPPPSAQRAYTVEAQGGSSLPGRAQPAPEARAAGPGRAGRGMPRPSPRSYRRSGRHAVGDDPPAPGSAGQLRPLISLCIDCPPRIVRAPLTPFHRQDRSIVTVPSQRLRSCRRPRWEQGHLKLRHPDAVPGPARGPGPGSGPEDRDHPGFGSAGWDPEATVAGWDPDASDQGLLLETTRPAPPGQQVGCAPCSLCALLASCSHSSNICNICHALIPATFATFA